jgi:hypothetical protein
LAEVDSWVEIQYWSCKFFKKDFFEPKTFVALENWLIAENQISRKAMLDEPVSHVVHLLRAAVHKLAGGKAVSEPKNLAAEDFVKLPKRCKDAFLAYQIAERAVGRSDMTDKEAYDYLKKNGWDDEQNELADYELPELNTFSNYLTIARRKLDRRKHTPQAGGGL